MNSIAEPSTARDASEKLGSSASRLEQALPRVLLLSTSLLTDRMMVHTEFLTELARHADVHIWASSLKGGRRDGMWKSCPATVEEFPEVRPLKLFPYTYLRRVNEFAWDYRLQPPSRLSMARHVRDKQITQLLRALKVPARLVTALGLERWLEKKVEGALLTYPRSPDASERLRASRPAAILTTGPFQSEQPAIVVAAKNLGIPVAALIPSWDNLSTKGRLVFAYDAYVVWSERTREELHHFYPESRNVPIHVVGAPQFDVFFQPRFQLSREAYCATQGLRPDLPIVLYAVGSPNFLKEHHGALYLAQRVQNGDLGDVQLVVRPHPIHDDAEMKHLFEQFGPRVVVQKTAEPGTSLNLRSQDVEQISEWVNTFRHADVVVNLSSTVAIDAAICDRPVVNLDYDPEPGQPNQDLIKDINHLWTHFKPVAESGGVWLVNNPEEMFQAVREYLRNPGLHREQRRLMAEYVCGFMDGRCGERMATAVREIVSNHART